MENNELKYWLAIAKINKIGAARFKRLYSYFPDMRTVWLEADTQDLIDSGIEAKIASEMISLRHEINPDAELETLRKNDVNAVTIHDDNYPRLLKEIYSPPAVLFYRGNLNELSDCAIAVVGTRKISAYGAQLTDDIVRDLAAQKITIVSGLALGIDARAHLAAVKHNTPTVAVLGSGLDRANIYPSSNRYIADQILAHNGILFSEYPIGTMPQKFNFPMRNRIISGLTLGTLVIEAGEVSGALITAAYALEQNREVFAVPGNVTNDNSSGVNKLIKQGAHVVLGAEDILEVLNLRQLITFQENKKILPDSIEEEKILKFLSKEPRHLDRLVQLTSLPASTVNSTLTMMELKGKVKNLGNQNYIINT
jgi:DNA processing protein